MMKFFKIILGILKGIKAVITVTASLLFILLFVGIFKVAYDFNNPSREYKVAGNGVLVLNLAGSLVDQKKENIFEKFTKNLLTRTYEKISTFDVVEVLKRATHDSRIKAIILDVNQFTGGDLTSIKYIGQALHDFSKKSGKEVIAISDYYSQVQYLLASYASKIELNPMGEVDIKGLSYENLYFKELIDKLKISPHIFKVGTYKAAVEPFLRNDMSAEAKENMQALLSQTWDSYKKIIAENRHISEQEVMPTAEEYIKELQQYQGDATKYAVAHKFVDEFMIKTDLENLVTKKYGSQRIQYNDYLAEIKAKSNIGNNSKIAVISIEGEIVDQDISDNTEYFAEGKKIASLIRRANKDPNIKALVIRINSPGGSAFASELVRQELEVAKKSKPIVVSMGAMAASGGYWIASTSDYIVADPDTVTGSIGIFGMLFTLENSLKSIGVTADGIASSELADSSIVKPLSKSLEKVLQLKIEHGYDKFISLVSAERGIDKQKVDAIAQGRVWTGRDALQNKLVDELGDFDTAIKKAEELAFPDGGKRKKKFSIEWLQSDPATWQQAIFSNMEVKLSSALLQSILGYTNMPELYKIKQQLNSFDDPKGMYLYCLNCGTIK